MMNHKETIEYALHAMEGKGADQAQVVVESNVMQEMNAESHITKLFRTTEETQAQLTYIKEHRKASTKINQTAREEIDQAVEELVQLSQHAPIDEANDIAPKVDDATFALGIQEPDMDRLYQSLQELNEEMKTRYPQISGDVVLWYEDKKKTLGNTNGLNLSETKGKYTFTVMFSAKDKDRITSFNYSYASLLDLSQRITQVGMLGSLFEQTIAELDAQPLRSKFEGDVIVNPLCLTSLLQMIAQNALMDGPMISGTSPLKDKIGVQVASELFTWESNPRSPDLAGGYAITSDGFVAEDTPIIDRGVLKTHLLTQYGANKTGRKRAPNYGDSFMVKPGSSSKEDMIQSVDRGILLSRFSGGVPAANGDFSGVAKNSFYIEKGKIQHPISEVMVSGNIFDLITHIQSVSQERVDFGLTIMPWVHATGVTISGK